MFLLILYILLAQGVSFACSLMEAAILSVNMSYIQNLENEGKKSGKMLRELKTDIDQTLAAILTLNTIANTMGATGAGAQAQNVFNNFGVSIFAVAFTFSILIFSEIIPKTIGAVHWRTLAPYIAYILKIMIFMLKPFMLVTGLITRFLTPKNKRNRLQFRQELRMMAEIGEDSGALSTEEENTIKNILNLSSIKVKDVLTPRTVVAFLSEEDTVKSFVQNDKPIRFSRIPVFKKNLDHITGMVLRTELLEAAARGLTKIKISAFIRPIHSVPASLTVAEAMNTFIRRREHIFVVIDEYGGTAGIITLEDAIEALIGKEIVDESDTTDDMQKLAKKLWQLKLKENNGQGS